MQKLKNGKQKTVTFCFQHLQTVLMSFDLQIKPYYFSFPLPHCCTAVQHLQAESFTCLSLISKGTCTFPDLKPIVLNITIDLSDNLGFFPSFILPTFCGLTVESNPLDLPAIMFLLNHFKKGSGHHQVS